MKKRWFKEEMFHFYFKYHQNARATVLQPTWFNLQNKSFLNPNTFESNLKTSIESEMIE